MTYLLDTNTCSAFLRGNQQVFSHVMQYLGRTAVSTITVGELLTWGYRRKSQRWLSPSRKLLDDLMLLDVTEEIADQFARTRAELLDIGRPTPEMDLFIAVTAITHDLILITHNLQDFQHIPGLKLADWTIP